jgi:glycine/D-amino acid oxidase-like deaminating enzyme
MAHEAQRRRRRELLAALAGLGTLAALPVAAVPGPHRVVVVGGGILGASIAMHLARRGTRVTLLESREPGAGATSKSFAWINPWADDPDYRTLRLASIGLWRALDAELGLGVTWGGYVDWTDEAREVAGIESLAALLDGTPDAVLCLDATELARVSPALAPGEVKAAFLSSLDGHADAVAVTQRMLNEARAYGAHVRFPVEVVDFDTARGAVRGVVADGRRIAADHVVLATGIDTPRLLARLGCRLALRHAPGILAYSTPGEVVTRLVYDGPRGLEFKQRPDGRVVGTDSEEAPDLPVHAGIRASAMDFPDTALRDAHGRRILERIGRYLPAARSRTLERLTLGYRVMPTDGFPIIGPVPGIANLTIAVTHSGVTLAPVLGRLVTAEVLDGALDRRLERFRASRMITSL